MPAPPAGEVFERLALLFLVLPAWSLTRRVRRWLANETKRRRLQRKCCPACGYDLRASPGRCPESV